jgi:hypothetical protein
MAKRFIYFCGMKASLIETVVLPLVPSIQKANFDYKFIHGNDLVDSRNRDNKDIAELDISKMSITKILQYYENDNPELVVCIGYKSLFDMLMVSLAKSLGIRTVYYEHGLHVSGVGDKYHFKLRTSLPRYLRLLRIYLKVIKHTNMKLPHEVYNSLRMIVFNRFSVNWHDYALFYTEYGKNLHEELSFEPDDRVHYSGYPFIDHDQSSNSQIRTSSKDKYAVIIHQPFIKDGLSDMTYANEFDYYAHLRTIVNKYGYQLVLKIHPRESIENYERVYWNSNIAITKEPLHQCIAESDLVFAHFSTALFYAIKLKKRIMILQYPATSPQSYKLFEDFGIHLLDDDSFELHLRKILEIADYNFSYYDKFCRKFIGENNSTEHAFSTIQKIVNKKKYNTVH